VTVVQLPTERQTQRREEFWSELLASFPAPARARFLSKVREGQTLETAARLTRTPTATIRLWVSATVEPDCPLEIAQFIADVEKEEAEAEAEMVECWRAAAPDDWHAAQAFLKSRYSDRWGDKIEREPLTVNVNVSGEVEVKPPDRAAMLSIAETLAEAGALPIGTVVDAEEVDEDGTEADSEGDLEDESDDGEDPANEGARDPEGSFAG
jgi:hypothetical protein